MRSSSIPSKNKACAKSRLLISFTIALSLQGCFLDRFFNPVKDVGPLVAFEPKFSYLQPGQSIELRARVLGQDSATFAFSEDSGGQIVSLVVLDEERVLVQAVGLGQARVFAVSGEDEGLAIVTVTE